MIKNNDYIIKKALSKLTTDMPIVQDKIKIILSIIKLQSFVITLLSILFLITVLS